MALTVIVVVAVAIIGVGGVLLLRRRARIRTIASALEACAGDEQGVGLELRAAAALLLVERQAAAGLRQRMRALVPEAVPAPEHGGADDLLGSLDPFLSHLDRSLASVEQAEILLERSPDGERASAVLQLGGLPPHEAAAATEVAAELRAGTLTEGDALGVVVDGATAGVDLVGGPLRIAPRSDATIAPGGQAEILRSLREPGDPREADRRELDATLHRVGLLDASDPDLVSAYVVLRDSYLADGTRLARAAVESVSRAAEGTRSNWIQGLGSPPSPQDAAETDLLEIVTELWTALESYRDRCVAVLASSTRRFLRSNPSPSGEHPAADAFAALGVALSESDAQVRQGQLDAALLTMSGERVPVAPDWAPAAQFQASSARALERLCALQDRHRQRRLDWFTSATSSFRAASATIRSELETAGATYRAGQERCWLDLEHAGADAIGAVVSALGQSLTEGKALGSQLWAMEHLILVEDAGAARLVEQLHALVPMPEAGEEASLDDHLDAIDERLAEVDGCRAELLAAASSLPADPRSRDQEAELAAGLLEFAGAPSSLSDAARQVAWFVRGDGGGDASAQEVLAQAAEGGVVWDDRPLATDAPAPPFAGLVPTAAQLRHPVDAAHEDGAAIDHLLADLQLTIAGAEVKGHAAFVRAKEQHPARLADLARGLESSIAEIIRNEGTASVERAGSPRTFVEAGGAALAALVAELGTALSTYLRQVEAIVGASERWPSGGLDPAGVRQALTSLGTTAAHLEAWEERGGSLARSFDTRVPIVARWAPAVSFEQTYDDVLRRTSELVDAHRDATAEWFANAAVSYEDAAELMRSEIETSITRYRDHQRRAFHPVEKAADALITNTAESLRTHLMSDGPSLRVRAVAGALAVDTMAALGLEQRVRDLIPEPGTPDGAGTVEGYLTPLDDLLARLDRNSAVVAAADGLLMATISDHVGGGIGQALRELGGVDRDVAKAASSALQYAHHGAGPAAEATVREFVSSTSRDIFPHFALAPHESLVQWVHQASSTLAGDMLKNADQPVVGLEHYLEAHGLESLHHFATLVHHAPQVQVATASLEHAGHLGGAAVLHGAMGHMPYITLALSTTREIRLHQQFKTELDVAVKNVVIDVAGVGAGGAAGFALAGVLHLAAGPAGLAIMAGGIVGRLISNKVKRKRFEEAMVAYGVASAKYDRDMLALTQAMSSSVFAFVHDQRHQFLGSVGTPPQIDASQAEKVRKPIGDLQAATGAYLAHLKALTEAAATRSSKAPKDDPLREQLGAAEDGLADSRARSSSGEPLEALVRLTDGPLPVVHGWPPAIAFAAACDSAATALGDVEEAYAHNLEKWFSRATERFRERERVIDAHVTSETETRKSQCEAAWAPVQQAGNLVSHAQAALA